MILGLAIIDGIALGLDLLLQVLHGLLVALGHGPLMVTEDGHGAIGPIVGQQLLRHRRTRIGEQIQLALQRFGGVVRTEYLGRESCK